MLSSPAPFPLSHNHFMLSRSFSNPQRLLLHPASNLAPHLTKNEELGKEHLDPCTYTGRCSGIPFRRPFCGNICLGVHTAALRLFLLVNGFFSPLLFREQCLNLLPHSALASSLSQHIFFFSSTSLQKLILCSGEPGCTMPRDSSWSWPHTLPLGLAGPPPSLPLL